MKDGVCIRVLCLDVYMLNQNNPDKVRAFPVRKPPLDNLNKIYYNTILTILGGTLWKSYS